MGTVVFVALRYLGAAVPSQQPEEMRKRLMPWLWWALLALFLSGSMFVIARPDRYFYNPVAAWKLACLVPAIVIALVLQHHSPGKRSAQVLSILLLGLLGGVVLAGRWIAYADYLYWE
jgi:drug/metabolite transporter (DMT)-like permease